MQLGLFLHRLVQAHAPVTDISKIYDENFLSADEYLRLWTLAQALPRERELNDLYGGKSFMKRLRMPCYSVSPYHRGDSTQKTKSKWIVPLETAPPEITSLVKKLSDIANFPINYLAFLGYENEKDHIAWHRHREDGCRDARVYIISLGDIRTFGLRKMCEACRLCEDCYETCNKQEIIHCKDARCQAAKQNRKTCRTCNDRSKWILLRPKPGSLISLSSEMNRTHEHAILDDTCSKSLRISINTKCIPVSDIQCMDEHATTRETVLAAKDSTPRVYDCHAGQSYPPEAVYVGREVRDRRTGKVTWPATPFGNYKKLTGDAFRAYAADKMNDATFRAQLESLRGKDLLCWCRPHEWDQCHAQIWLELANALASKANEQEKP